MKVNIKKKADLKAIMMMMMMITEMKMIMMNKKNQKKALQVEMEVMRLKN